MRDRVILHCDMNSFFASVELLEHPELKDEPVAVCGDPESRHGIILAKNQRAKAAGVKTAMVKFRAQELCPGLICLPPHRWKYKHYSVIINEIYKSYTDMVEPFSIDESWLDVTASQKLFGTGPEIADRIRSEVREKTGLTLSAGVSFNKTFAKMGSEYKKPDATTVITRQNYRDLLWPLPVTEFFFVGKATGDKLARYGIHTIGDLARADRPFLSTILGKQGPLLADRADGIDDDPVSESGTRRTIKSVGNGMTFRRNIQGPDEIRVALTYLSDTVAARLRKYELKAAGVKVDIKDPNLKTISRQQPLLRPTDTARELADGCFSLIEKSGRLNQPIRLLTVTAINLMEADEPWDVQIGLFDSGNDEEEREKSKNLDRTVDSIRGRYGKSSISYARVLKNDIGIEVEDHDEEIEFGDNPFSLQD